MKSSWKYLFGVPVLIVVTVWLAVIVSPDNKLHLIACDVGQGDAILATYRKTQILIDGGPDRSVLTCLSEHMPFWDREIEVVILTHPEADHFTGLIEVFKRYRVKTLVATPLDVSSQGYQVLKNIVGGSGTRVVNPTSGMVIRLGLLYLDIVYPASKNLGLTNPSVNNDVLGAFSSNQSPNDFSIVANLRLGEFDALLTGDIGPKVISDVLATGKIRDIDYIKIPHHGSKNGLTKELLEASVPEIAVISVGKNPWGHPHQEVLQLLQEAGVRTLRTDQEGDIEIITDGKNTWLMAN
jgi:competence protein ComEC